MSKRYHVQAGDFIEGEIINLTWEKVERLLFVLRTEKLVGYSISFDGKILFMFSSPGNEVTVSAGWLKESGWIE